MTVKVNGNVPASTYNLSINASAPGASIVTGTSVGLVVTTGVPSISQLLPSSGTVGTAVTITGKNLTGATNVSFNGASAGYTVNGGTQINISVPSGASTGNVTVTTPAGVSNGLPFTVPINAEHSFDLRVVSEVLRGMADGAQATGTALDGFSLLLAAEGAGLTGTGAGALVGVPSLAGAVAAEGGAIISKVGAFGLRAAANYYESSLVPKEEELSALESAVNQFPDSPEVFGRYQLFGNKYLQGNTFIRNVVGINFAGSKGTNTLLEFRALIKAFEDEARLAGASEIRINGFITVNKSFLNSATAGKFGYTFIQEGKTIQLFKVLK